MGFKGLIDRYDYEVALAIPSELLIGISVVIHPTCAGNLNIDVVWHGAEFIITDQIKYLFSNDPYIQLPRFNIDGLYCSFESPTVTIEILDPNLQPVIDTSSVYLSDDRSQLIVVLTDPEMDGNVYTVRVHAIM